MKKLYIEINPKDVSLIRENLKEIHKEWTPTEVPFQKFLEDCLKQLHTSRNPELTYGGASILEAEILSSKLFDKVEILRLNEEIHSCVVKCSIATTLGFRPVIFHSMREWNEYKKYHITELSSVMGRKEINDG